MAHKKGGGSTRNGRDSQAKRLGVERLLLKGGRLVLYFVHNPDSPYYQSAAFDRVIQYATHHFRRCELAETNGKRRMRVADVSTVAEARTVLDDIIAGQPVEA